MIRVLHTADWHLGHTFFGYDRAREQEAFLEWLKQTVAREEIDALLVAGDVFDVSNPSAAAQQMYYRFIHQITAENPGLQLVIVAGNHDSAARLEAPLPLLQAVRAEVRGIIRRREDGEIDYDRLLLPLKNRAGEPELLCMAVPFLRQGDYPAVPADGNAYAEGVRAFYGRLFQHACARKEASQALVAVGHLQTLGAEIAEKDYSERTVIGGLECVSPHIFSEEIAYVALGHIHKAQRVSGRDHVRYAGSPLPLSFAERHYRHGVQKVVFDNGVVVENSLLECPQWVPVISLNDGVALPPEEALEQLRRLPDVEGEAPYLEVSVLLKEPEPMLPQKVSEALSGKHYRLARITPVYLEAARMPGQEAAAGNVRLQDMTPLRIAQKAFEETYHTEMPEELVALFEQVCMSVIQKNAEE